MAGDEVVEVRALHIDLATELAEGDAALVTVLLELTTTDTQLFAYFLAGEVLIRTHATDICLGQLLAHGINKVHAQLFKFFYSDYFDVHFVVICGDKSRKNFLLLYAQSIDLQIFSTK